MSRINDTRPRAVADLRGGIHPGERGGRGQS
jgi:hypothetical protein